MCVLCECGILYFYWQVRFVDPYRLYQKHKESEMAIVIIINTEFTLQQYVRLNEVEVECSNRG